MILSPKYRVKPYTIAFDLQSKREAETIQEEDILAEKLSKSKKRKLKKRRSKLRRGAEDLKRELQDEPMTVSFEKDSSSLNLSSLLETESEMSNLESCEKSDVRESSVEEMGNLDEPQADVKKETSCLSEGQIPIRTDLTFDADLSISPGLPKEVPECQLSGMIELTNQSQDSYNTSGTSNTTNSSDCSDTNMSEDSGINTIDSNLLCSTNSLVKEDRVKDLKQLATTLENLIQGVDLSDKQSDTDQSMPDLEPTTNTVTLITEPVSPVEVVMVPTNTTNSVTPTQSLCDSERRPLVLVDVHQEGEDLVVRTKGGELVSALDLEQLIPLIVPTTRQLSSEDLHKIVGGRGQEVYTPITPLGQAILDSLRGTVNPFGLDPATLYVWATLTPTLKLVQEQLASKDQMLLQQSKTIALLEQQTQMLKQGTKESGGPVKRKKGKTSSAQPQRMTPELLALPLDLNLESKVPETDPEKLSDFDSVMEEVEASLKDSSQQNQDHLDRGTFKEPHNVGKFLHDKKIRGCNAFDQIFMHGVLLRLVAYFEAKRKFLVVLPALREILTDSVFSRIHFQITREEGHSLSRQFLRVVQLKIPVAHYKNHQDKHTKERKLASQLKQAYFWFMDACRRTVARKGKNLPRGLSKPAHRQELVLLEPPKPKRGKRPHNKTANKVKGGHPK